MAITSVSFTFPEAGTNPGIWCRGIEQSEYSQWTWVTVNEIASCQPSSGGPEAVKEQPSPEAVEEQPSLEAVTKEEPDQESSEAVMEEQPRLEAVTKEEPADEELADWEGPSYDGYDVYSPDTPPPGSEEPMEKPVVNLKVKKPVVNLRGSIALSFPPPAPMARGNTAGSSYGNLSDDREALLKARCGDAASSGGATAGKRIYPEEKIPDGAYGKAFEQTTPRRHRFDGADPEETHERRVTVKIARVCRSVEQGIPCGWGDLCQFAHHRCELGRWILKAQGKGKGGKSNSGKSKSGKSIGGKSKDGKRH